jgi:hypothetical protein
MKLDLMLLKKPQFSHNFLLGPSDLKWVVEIVYNNFITTSICNPKYTILKKYKYILFDPIFFNENLYFSKKIAIFDSEKKYNTPTL